MIQPARPPELPLPSTYLYSNFLFTNSFQRFTNLVCRQPTVPGYLQEKNYEKTISLYVYGYVHAWPVTGAKHFL
jgi:uncharacterized membrane protein YbaN (DUF454 family)